MYVVANYVFLSSFKKKFTINKTWYILRINHFISLKIYSLDFTVRCHVHIKTETLISVNTFQVLSL